MSRNIAIGDIHGCVNTLKALVEEKIVLKKKDNLFLLGDYVNKGPDSKGTIDYILDLKRKGYCIECLRGNHDQLMLNAWRDEHYFEEWVSRGGDTTLQSFDCDSLKDVPISYYSFLSTTLFFLELENHLLVHGGFNFEADDIYDDMEAMLNVKEMEVNLTKTEGKRIVHGHIPLELEQVKATLQTNWKDVSIDTGCVYTDQAGKGFLSALDLDTHDLIYIKNKE